MSISPAQLRDLASRADALRAEARALYASLPAESPERAHLQAAHQATDWLQRAGEDLQRAAEDLARFRALQECGFPWGVCPEHGNTLSFMVNVTTCRVCGRTWDNDRRSQKCREPVTWKVTDPVGTETLMCNGHVLGARAATNGATFTRLDVAQQ
ncbi:hypothetical protein [Nonomuraea sediminis]|uniref:hypothetical protein n=1 Tax=Nonomuraea sediminis TaxID=2835864 RepID=UPI001BDC8130|nr:hypothetical protein [Nonomuraea sediminis]